MSTFLITGFGRSGTKFLSTILNNSEQFTVNHEDMAAVKCHNDGDLHVQNYGQLSFYLKECSYSITDKLSMEFGKKKHYGEVNSFFREIIDRIDVDKKAVIVRNPRNMLMSSYNLIYGNTDRYQSMCHVFNNGLNAVDRLITMGMKVFSFDKITTDINYIYEIADYVGITDLKLTDEMINPLNSSKRNVNSFDEIDDTVKELCLPTINKFTDKYFKYF